MDKVTVLDKQTSLDFINIGEVINFQKEPTNSVDPNAIKAFYNNSMIGYVAASSSTVMPGTQANIEIYQNYADTFSGKVTGQSVMSGRTQKTVLIVELTGSSVNPTPGSSGGATRFIFKCKGSSTKYLGKKTVLDAVNSGTKYFLTLDVDSISGQITATTPTNVPAGEIEEKEIAGCSNLEELAILKQVIANEALEGRKIECRAIEAEAVSYKIEIQIPNATIDACQTQVAKKAIGTVRQKLVNDGFPEARLTMIEDYLLKNGFTPSEIQQIFETYKVYPQEVQHRIVDMPKNLYINSNGSLRIAYAALTNGYHVLCSGDKGTGKNCLITTWAWVTQRPLFEVSINRETDKLDVLGGKIIDVEIDPTTGRAMDKITFSPEVLLEAMELGAIINIDEINFADPGVTGLLHSICDDRKTIEVPGYKKVVADENFMVMATMNVDYQGTNELNEALADRFVDIVFPSNDSIFDILISNCPMVPQSEVHVANKVYEQIYGLIKSRDSSLSSECLTVRGFIQALQMSKILGLKKALQVCVADKVKDSAYRDRLLQIIDTKA